MSWCRFSSVVDENNRSSDLYIYDNDSGVFYGQIPFRRKFRVTLDEI